MNFLESIITCYIKIFNYRGRASKSEYWWFQLYFSLLAILMFGLVEAENVILGIRQIIFWLYCFNNLPLFSAAVRRFHDMNASGWTLAAALIPVIGTIWVLVKLAGAVTKGKNKFGPKPKK